MAFPSKEQFEAIYGVSETQTAQSRFRHLEEGYQQEFGNADLSYYTSPGRTEIVGNHTDHNGGKVLASSINLDTIGAAAKNEHGTIEILSEGYPKIIVELSKLSEVPKEGGTRSLVAGIAEATSRFGFQISGFCAYLTTNVIASAGVSSSASFEMIVCAIINDLFNDGKMTPSDYAKIGQYAENVYWNKASGLMDQMACGFGGPILLDFAGEIQVEQIPFGFADYGYSMVITNTGKGHADLSDEYSAVPQEMFAVAKALGKERLCEVSLEELLEQFAAIRETIQNDRAMLRAIHFLSETKRVADIARAIEAKDFPKILAIIEESGHSSYEVLQNAYCIADWKEQPISVALALTNVYLKKIGAGVCRLHGGGFAGVIQTILPQEETDSYVQYMEQYFGKGNVYPMNLRQTGAVRIA